MKQNKIITLITCICAIIPIIYYFIIQNTLPEQIPMHYDFQGNIDRYGDKSELILLALLPLGMFLLFTIIPKLDPKGKSYEKIAKFYDIFKLFMTLFMNVVFFIIVREALYPGTVNITLFTLVAVGILFILIGNYMPKFKPNYTMGIKTPWTLHSERVWIKTHRLGGYTFMISGILFILMSFTSEKLMLLLVGMNFVIILIPCVASYFFYQQELKGGCR